MFLLIFLNLFHRTALHVALHFDYLDIAKILIDSDTSKISLNTQDYEGRLVSSSFLQFEFDSYLHNMY